MKLIAVLLLCVWLTGSQDLIPQEGRGEERRLALRGSYSQSDCEIEYIQPHHILHWNTLNSFRYFMTVPVARWDCFLYKQLKEKGKKESDIAKIEPRVSIFTWLEVYDSETEISKDRISVNSIIAIAFWAAAGFPTFVALLLLFVGDDKFGNGKRNTEMKNMIQATN